ncbi:MAG: hypothetical protein NUW37_09520 [Planctomycetes bacterium]|nr:hypothetical protein [Planctomycetota bacterium]
MTSLSNEPVYNVVQNGIIRGIKVAIENECFGSAVILIYSGIDTMAYIAMPENRTEVKSEDFISWVDRYIKFKCNEQVTGEELWGARCGMLHSFGPESSKSRRKENPVRLIGYTDHSIPEVRYDPSISTSLVMVSIKALAESFVEGANKFIVCEYANVERREIAMERLLKWLMYFRLAVLSKETVTHIMRTRAKFENKKGGSKPALCYFCFRNLFIGRDVR